MIEAELPDGTVLEFPEGTDQAVIQRVVRQRLGVPEAEAPAPSRGLGEVITSGLKQIPYGFNEALGSLASGAEYAVDVALGPLWDRKSRSDGPISGLFLNETMAGPEPTNRFERSMRSAGSMLGAAAPTMALPLAPAAQAAANSLRGGAGRQAFNEMIKAYGRNPASLTATDAVASLGAGAGGQTVEEMGGPRLLGELGGGVAAGFMATGGVTGALARSGRRALAKVAPEAQKAAGRDFVKSKLGAELGSDAAQANLRRAAELQDRIEGFNPRLGEASNVPSLLTTQDALDNSLRGPDMDVITSRQAANNQAIDRFAASVAPDGVADAAQAVAPTEARVSRLLARVGEQRGKARTEAERIAARNQQLKEVLANRKERASTELATVRQQAADDQFSIRDADLAQVAEEARVRDAAQEAMRQLDADVAGQRADAAGGLGRRVDRADMGERIRGRVNDIRRSRREELNRVAEEMGLNDANFITPFRRFAARVEEELKPKSIFQDNATIPQEYMPIVETAKVLDKVSFADVKALRERVGSDLRQAMAASDGPSRQRAAGLIKLQRLIDDELLAPEPFALKRSGDGGDAIDIAMSYLDRDDFKDFVRFARGQKIPEPQRLRAFVRSKGGLKDYNGEFRAREDLRGLLRENTGKNADDMALQAWEAGYMPEFRERPSINDFLAALEDDVNDLAPRYREADMSDALRYEEMATAADELQRALGDLGIDINAGGDQIRAAVSAMDKTRGASIGIPEKLASDYQLFRKRYFEEYIEPFERSAVAKIRRKDGKSFYRTQDEDVAAAFIGSQDGAKQYASLFSGDQQAIADIEAALIDDLADSALVDGVFRPAAFERWLNSKRGVLAEFPDVQKRLQGLFDNVQGIERRYAETKDAIGSRKADALAQIGLERRKSRQLALDTRKGASEQQRAIEAARDQDIAAVRAEQEALDQAMEPVARRLEVLADRQKRIEQSVLGRKVRSLTSEGVTPEQLVERAVRDSRQMLRLLKSVGKDGQAKRALQRTVWDQVADLDGAKMRQFIDQNEGSLKLLFSKEHLDNLRMIQDARAIMERSPVVKGRPINTDPVKQIEEMTGFNPRAAAASYIGVNRGRSSRTVEFANALGRWFGASRKMEADALLRAALDDPDVAKRLIEELSIPAVREGRKPPALTRVWALNSYIGNDGGADADQ